jgi:hypothetical protein
MGRNYDPATLHKYAYGNFDPINHSDPSGHFSLSSIGSAINIQGVLSTTARATYSVARSAGGGRRKICMIRRPLYGAISGQRIKAYF